MSILKTKMNLFRRVKKGLTKVHADTMATTVNFTNAVRTVYSKEIMFHALPVMRFYQFADIKTDLTATAGKTIQMMTYDNLKKGGKLTEGTKMTTQGLSSTYKNVTVVENGNAVAVSELLLVTSFDDVLASTVVLLGRDMALVLDCELRDTALSGTNVIYADKSDKSKVAARAELDGTCILKVSTIKDGVEILATNNAPKIGGLNYVCFVHPHQSRSLRDDPAWINASNYGAPDQLFSGEIGKIDDVRFIETTLMCNGAVADTDPAYKAALKKGTSGNLVDVYQAVLFGDKYYGYAEALPVELRDNGVTDFGREHGIAWYGIWGSAVLHDGRGVVIETD